MRQISFLAILVIVFLSSCQGQSPKNKISSREQVCLDLISSLTSHNYDKALEAMDEIVLEKIPSDSLKVSFAALSDRIEDQFQGSIIKTTFITSEKTILNDRPAFFLIFKLESKTFFGFYYFYINEKSNKVMLISAFSKTEPKRE